MRFQGRRIVQRVLSCLLAFSGSVVAFGFQSFDPSPFGQPSVGQSQVDGTAFTLSQKTAFEGYSESGEIVASRLVEGRGAAKAENTTGEIATIGKLVSIEPAPENSQVFRSWGIGQELEFMSPEMWDESMGRRDRRLILPSLREISREPYVNYRRNESTFSFLPGSGDDLGWMDFKSDHFLDSGYRSGFSTGIGIHLLSGPKVVHAPPRLYSLTLGYQRRNSVGDSFSYDVAASVGIYTDFEGSARDGIRFPGHAVGVLHQSPETDFVFGLDFLDREDYFVLPVFGVSHRSDRFENMRFDFVFPRPQVEYAMQSGRIVYMAGRLGGDSWDMEFPNGQEDILTYRETQLLLGTRRNGLTNSAIEVGYAYNRRLEFDDFRGKASPGGAFMIRFTSAR